MNTLYRTGKLKVTVYADHNPPHFHVITPDGESLINLVSFTEIKSGANRKQLAKAIEWASAHRTELEIEWHRLNPR